METACAPICEAVPHGKKRALHAPFAHSSATDQRMGSKTTVPLRVASPERTTPCSSYGSMLIAAPPESVTSLFRAPAKHLSFSTISTFGTEPRIVPKLDIQTEPKSAPLLPSHWSLQVS